MWISTFSFPLPPYCCGRSLSRPLLLSSLLVCSAVIPARRSGEEESGGLILAAAGKARVSTRPLPLFHQVKHQARRSTHCRSKLLREDWCVRTSAC